MQDRTFLLLFKKSDRKNHLLPHLETFFFLFFLFFATSSLLKAQKLTPQETPTQQSAQIKLLHHRKNFFDKDPSLFEKNRTAYDDTTSPWLLENFYELENSPDFISWLQNDKFASQNWWDYRTALAEKGIDLNLYATQEVWGNTTGGITQAATSNGILQGSLMLDLEKMSSWKRGYFFSHWVYLYGEDPNSSLSDSVLYPSALAGYSTLRSTELWFEQYLFDDHLSIRVGELMVDQEFVIANYATLFLNDAFGWPPFISANIPNEGPAYPMAAPGVRLHVTPQKNLNFSSVFIQSNVESQEENNHGFYWNLHPNQGYLSINEGSYQFGYHYPTSFKGGVWFDTSWFPRSDNPEEQLWGNCGVYGICDHLLIPKKLLVAKEEKKEKTFDSEGLGWFGRVAYEPSDRNIVNFFCDSGFTYKGPLPTRHQDICGLGFGYAQFSPGAIHYQEQNTQENELTPWNSQPIEAIGVGAMGAYAFEAMYQIQVTPWMNIKPDIQYLITQGTGENLDNSLLLCLQTNIVF